MLKGTRVPEDIEEDTARGLKELWYGKADTLRDAEDVARWCGWNSV